MITWALTYEAMITWALLTYDYLWALTYDHLLTSCTLGLYAVGGISSGTLWILLLFIMYKCDSQCHEYQMIGGCLILFSRLEHLAGFTCPH